MLGDKEDGTETVASLDRLRALYTRKARTCLAHPFPLACVTFPSPANFFCIFPLLARAYIERGRAGAQRDASSITLSSRCSTLSRDVVTFGNFTRSHVCTVRSETNMVGKPRIKEATGLFCFGNPLRSQKRRLRTEEHLAEDLSQVDIASWLAGKEHSMTVVDVKAVCISGQDVKKIYRTSSCGSLREAHGSRESKGDVDGKAQPAPRRGAASIISSLHQQVRGRANKACPLPHRDCQIEHGTCSWPRGFCFPG